MSKRFFALSVLVLASFSAYAAGENTKQPGSGNEAKHQEMFSKIKQVRIDGIQGRIAILQTALNCVNAATNHEQMESCAQQEHQAMAAHKEKQEAEREGMKTGGGPK